MFSTLISVKFAAVLLKIKFLKKMATNVADML